MVRAKDIAGQRFGRLLVMSYAGSGKWLCRCDCGNMVTPRTDSLSDGNSTSCGCARRKHGSSNNPTYRVWIGIKARCLNKNDTNYADYGGRGIKICDRWMDFSKFVEDMGDRPKGLEIDRKDNDGHYEPGNCRWVTRRENMLNTRRSHNITWNGNTRTISEWADVLGITQSSLADRLRSGVPMEKVMKPGNQRKDDAILELNGERLTVTEWADRLNINKQTLYARVYAGWTDEKALTTPTRKKSPSKKDTAT